MPFASIAPRQTYTFGQRGGFPAIPPSRPLTELAPFAAVAFGTGWLSTGVAALPLFATGSYAPPAGLDHLVAPEPGMVLSASCLQSHGPASASSARSPWSSITSSVMHGRPSPMSSPPAAR